MRNGAARRGGCLKLSLTGRALRGAYVIHNRVLLSVVHFGRQLRPSMALEAGVATHRAVYYGRRCFSIGRRGGFRGALRGKAVFPARVSLLTTGVTFPTRLSRLLGLPSFEGQSRGTPTMGGACERPLRRVPSSKLVLLSFSEKFLADTKRTRTEQGERHYGTLLRNGAAMRKNHLWMIRVNC